MAKKNYFEDLISEEDLLSGYKHLPGEVKKKGQKTDFVSQNEGDPDKGSAPASSTATGKKKGRPKKTTVGENNKTFHIEVSLMTKTKLSMCRSCVSMSQGVKCSNDKMISMALDLFMERECPDLFRSLKFK